MFLKIFICHVQTWSLEKSVFPLLCHCWTLKVTVRLHCMTSINTVSSGKAVLCMLSHEESEHCPASRTRNPPQTRTN